MSSVSIYTSTQVHPYVYKLVHPLTGEFYIGVRSSNKIPADQDLPHYKTSSVHVKPRFHEFDQYILAEFFTKEAAYDFEQQMIYECWKNPLLMNKACHHNNTARFSVAGMKHSDETKSKLRAARAKQIFTEDQVARMKLGPTPEAIEKIKLARKYQSITIETGKKISDSNMRHAVSTETRDKISKARIGMQFTEDHCKSMSDARKGRSFGPMSIEHKQKIANSHIGKTHSDESKRKMSDTKMRNKQLRLAEFQNIPH